MKFVSVFCFFLFVGCNDKVTIDGTIRMVGNVPFTQLVIHANGYDYQFYPDDKKKYKHLVGKSVTFFGQVDTHQLVSADGKHSFDVFYLKTDSLKLK